MTIPNCRRRTVDIRELIHQGVLWDRWNQITDTIAEDLTAGKKLIEEMKCGMGDELVARFYSNSGKSFRCHADEDPILVIITNPEDHTLLMNYLFPHA